MLFLQSFESIFIVVLLCAVGYFLARAGWLNASTNTLFAKLVLNVSLPCYMIANILESFDRKTFLHDAHGLIVPVLSIGVCYFLGVGVSLLFRVDKRRRGLFRSVFFTSNTIFIGLPVNEALFGASSLPYVLLYYFANTTFFWTLGNWEISRDNQLGPKPSPAQGLKKALLTPALLGFLLAVALLLLGAQLPKFLLKTCSLLGGLTTPLAMLFIGTVLYSFDLRRLRPDRDAWLLMAGRFVVCPLVVFGLCRLIPVPPLMEKVFIIQSAMPAMTSTGIVAKGYGSDYEFGTAITVYSTLAAMLVIPVLRVLLQ